MPQRFVIAAAQAAMKDTLYSNRVDALMQADR